MVLAVGLDHPFAGRKRIMLAEPHRQELVLQTKSSDARHILDGNFKSVGAEPVIVAEMNAAAPMISLVQELNIGAIVSKHFASLFQKVRFIPLESPTPLRTAGILSKSARPKSLACYSFISEIRMNRLSSCPTSMHSRKWTGYENARCLSYRDGHLSEMCATHHVREGRPDLIERKRPIDYRSHLVDGDCVAHRL